MFKVESVFNELDYVESMISLTHFDLNVCKLISDQSLSSLNILN